MPTTVPIPMQRREAIQEAVAFKAEHPTEQACTGARIYHVNESSVRSNIRRRRAGVPTQHGGQNKVLSTAQIEALTKYIEDMYLSGLGATKQMVFGAIAHLRAAENPPKKPPSIRWFQTFLKGHPELFRTVKTKPIAIERVSAQDIDEVRKWFINWTAFCEKHHIKSSDVLNFDETGFRIGVASGEEILVPTYVKEVNY